MLLAQGLGLVDAEKHDHEQEEDDDGAGVDDDLDGGEEVGLLGDEEHGHAEQRRHQRQRRVHGVAVGDDAHGPAQDDGRGNEEDDSSTFSPRPRWRPRRRRDWPCSGARTP